MRDLGYMLACLIVPALWGLSVSWIYDRVAERRKQLHPEQAEESVEMYHI